MTRFALAGAALTMTSIVACGSTGPASPATTTSAQPTAAASGTTQSSSAAPTSNLPPAAVEVNPAGDIPDTQVFVPYTLPSGAFSVSVPEGWARAESGGVTTFSDHFNSIRLETVAAGSAPTVASAQTGEVPAIRQQQPNVSDDKVVTVVRTAGNAVLITYRTDSSPDPVTAKRVRLAIERYEFWRSGSEAILTLSSPVGSDNVDPWRKVTDSFRWR